MHNNLDKFVRDKFQEREFEFNAAHWEAAAALIEKDEQLKFWKNFGWASLAVILFFAGGIGGYFFSGNNQATVVATNKTNNSEQSVIASSKDQISKSLLETSSPSLNTTEHTTLADKTSNAFKQTAKQTKESHTIINSKQTNIAFSTDYISTTKLAEQSIMSPSSKTTDSQMEAKEITKEAILKPVIKAAATAVDYLALSPLANEANQKDILQNNTSHPVIDGRSRKLLKGIILGGTSYTTSSNTNIGLTAGLSIKYKLRPQISLNADLIYQYRPGNFSSVASTKDVNYGFGKTEIENLLLPTSLHYVELPVYLQYQTGRHFLEAGLSASYLTGIRGGIVKNDVLDTTTPLIIDKVTWLENKAFKPLNAQVLLGYQFGLSPNASIGLRANYTLGGIQNVSTAIKPSKLYFSATAKWFLF